MDMIDYFTENEVEVFEKIGFTESLLTEADMLVACVNEDEEVELLVIKFKTAKELNIEEFSGIEELAEFITFGEIVDSFVIGNPKSLKLTLQYIAEEY